MDDVKIPEMRTPEYLADLRNLVREMRAFADSHQRMIDSAERQRWARTPDYYELVGSVRARRGDALELELWLDANNRKSVANG